MDAEWPRRRGSAGGACSGFCAMAVRCCGWRSGDEVGFVFELLHAAFGGGDVVALAEVDNPLFPALRSAPTAVSGASRQKQIPSSQPPFPRPPVRPNGCFRSIPPKANS